jgi:hypothetical protein
VVLATVISSQEMQKISCQISNRVGGDEILIVNDTSGIGSSDVSLPQMRMAGEFKPH